MSEKTRIIWEIIQEKSALTKALKIALVVGIILNLINQGEALAALDSSAIHLPKLLLTLCVPFCVSLYTATTIALKMRLGAPAPAEVNLECAMHPGQIVHLHKGDTIPACEACGIHTRWQIHPHHPHKEP